MTTTSAPHQPAIAAARPGPPRWRRYLPAAAGAAYLAAWAAGLAAWPSNLALNATNAQVTAAYRAHPAGAVAQYVLAEGLAGLLLAIVLGFALLPLAQRGLATRAGARPATRAGARLTTRAGGRPATQGGARPTAQGGARLTTRAGARPTSQGGARPAAGLAAAAVVISLVQCVLGLVLVAAATSADVARAGGLSALENRLDGVKMLALAGVAAYLAVTRARTGSTAGAMAGTAAAGTAGAGTAGAGTAGAGTATARAAVAGAAAARPRPRWLRATALLAAVALASSAVAYLFLANALAWTVYLSGPLLLLWVAATGIWLTAGTRLIATTAGQAVSRPADA